MNKTFTLVSVALLGFVVWREYANTPKTIVTSAGVKENPSTWNPSGDWKDDLPVPLNLFNSRPYGWSGQPANAYLPETGGPDPLPTPTEAISPETGGLDPSISSRSKSPPEISGNVYNPVTIN